MLIDRCDGPQKLTIGPERASNVLGGHCSVRLSGRTKHLPHF